MNIPTPLLALGAAALMSACASDTDGPTGLDTANAPLFLEAGDFEAIDTGRLDICLGPPQRVLQFAEPDDIRGVSVRLGRSGETTFTTEMDPDLDTVLYLYGPKDENGYYGRQPIAGDDNGGIGLQSKLTLNLEAGDWFVVVATSGGSLGSTTLSAIASCGNDYECFDDSDCEQSAKGATCEFNRCQDLGPHGSCYPAMNPDCADFPGTECVLHQCLPPGLASESDLDGDGVSNEEDNCVNVYNPAQYDSDADGIGENCDADYYPPRADRD